MNCHSQNKKDLFLDKITLFKAFTGQNIGSYKITNMACSLHMPVDGLYEQIPEDWFWLKIKKKQVQGSISLLLGGHHWKRNMK